MAANMRTGTCILPRLLLLHGYMVVAAPNILLLLLLQEWGSIGTCHCWLPLHVLSWILGM